MGPSSGQSRARGATERAETQKSAQPRLKPAADLLPLVREEELTPAGLGERAELFGAPAPLEEEAEGGGGDARLKWKIASEIPDRLGTLQSSEELSGLTWFSGRLSRTDSSSL